ncbi:hypothetical protein [Sagittula stellata]|uniref:Uncharacterized protein n=1 Tax=Sagittula stellata (strain ATCC 700073 / DSM 11524 / E-37) TaxID=388399 RepID=A3KA39_SAGS3|nr:hypothetical protein [Sagittula stellata]EBA05982.1 hypothetical protein SSE37_25278 [Sagittula stellata E-37]
MIVGVYFLLLALVSSIATMGVLRRVRLIDLLTGRYSAGGILIVVVFVALTTVLAIFGLMNVAGIA